MTSSDLRSNSGKVIGTSAQTLCTKISAMLLILAFSAPSARANSMDDCLAALDWPACGTFCTNPVETEGILLQNVECKIQSNWPSGAIFSRTCTINNVPLPGVLALVNSCGSACDTYYSRCPDEPPPPCPDPPRQHGPIEKFATLEDADLVRSLRFLKKGETRLVNGVLLWRANPLFTNGQEGIFAVTMEDVGAVSVDSIPTRIALAFDADILNHSDAMNEYSLLGDNVTVLLRKTPVDWSWLEAERPLLPLTFELKVIPGFLKADSGESILSQE